MIRDIEYATGDRVRHNGTHGEYVVIEIGLAKFGEQWRACIAYRNVGGGTLFVREVDEFRRKFSRV